MVDRLHPPLVQEARGMILNQYFQFLPNVKIFSKIVKTIFKYCSKIDLELIMPRILYSKNLLKPGLTGFKLVYLSAMNEGVA